MTIDNVCGQPESDVQEVTQPESKLQRSEVTSGGHIPWLQWFLGKHHAESTSQGSHSWRGENTMGTAGGWGPWLALC